MRIRMATVALAAFTSALAVSAQQPPEGTKLLDDVLTKHPARLPSPVAALAPGSVGVRAAVVLGGKQGNAVAATAWSSADPS